MWTRALTGAVCLGLAAAWFGCGQPPTTPKDAERIGELVKQLGSESFDEREQAKKDLDTVGFPALPALRKAAKGGDLETARRAAELVRRIEERTLHAELLAPKRVRLKLKDTPILEAVAELARQSGYVIDVEGDRTLLTGKTVTLDTGEVTFFEALDRLSAVTGLTERTPFRPSDIVYDDRGRPIGPGAPMAPKPIDQRLLNLPKARLPLIPVPLTRPMQEPLPIPRDEAEKDADSCNDQVPEVSGEIGRGIRVPALPLVMVPVGAGPPADGGAAAMLVSSVARVVLIPGKAAKGHTCYAGATRLTLTPVGRGADGQAHEFRLDATPEPRLEGFAFLGRPAVEKAIDEHGQSLKPAAEPAPDPNAGKPVDNPVPGLSFGTTLATLYPVSTTLGLQPATKVSRQLKVLAGTLSVQVEVPNQALASIDNVMKASGKSADVRNGGTLRLDKIEDLTDGKIQVQATLEQPADRPKVARYVLRRAARLDAKGRVINDVAVVEYHAEDNLPDLVDAAGKKLQRVGTPSVNNDATANNQLISRITMVFRPHEGQGGPDRLVLVGSRAVTLSVPFRFENVPVSQNILPNGH